MKKERMRGLAPAKLKNKWEGMRVDSGEKVGGVGVDLRFELVVAAAQQQS